MSRLYPALLTLVFFSAPTSAQDGPRASQVVVRGIGKLHRALDLATEPAWRADKRKPPVAIIVDVTPYTRRAQAQLAAACALLDAKFPDGGRFRIGALGGRLGAQVKRPGLLGVQLDKVLARNTPTVNTLDALYRTLRSFRDRRGVIVYLADWHFEDDFALEDFIGRLKARDQVFTTIGTEACFSRAWNDGFYPPDRGAQNGRGETKLYDENIGRAPFDHGFREAPWHGGDSAYSHLPFYFHGGYWSTKFPADIKVIAEKETRPYAGKKKKKKKPSSKEEDLRERMGDQAKVEERTERYWFPLPSSFGPYGLMRIAAMTEGRYILWSWNPQGRSDLVYDIAACNRQQPDLRSRRDILRDARKSPLMRGILSAWHLVCNKDIYVISTTAPLTAKGRLEDPIEELRGTGFLAYGWDTRADWQLFLDRAELTLPALDQALRALETALARPAVDDIANRRYLADAHYMQHVLRVHRFTIGEALQVARTLKMDAWDKEGLYPGLDPEILIDPSGNLRPFPHHQEKLARRLVAERRNFIERYQGTPHGELVARNRVEAFKLYWNRRASGIPGRETPAESSGKHGVPTTPRSGGSRGPTSGGK